MEDIVDGTIYVIWLISILPYCGVMIWGDIWVYWVSEVIINYFSHIIFIFWSDKDYFCSSADLSKHA
ncbi:MAG: hypothetical protein EBZ58_09870 [Bacteroidetes bacterium]|nr:hypothetical protein [Bacteroidota bacterium]